MNRQRCRWTVRWTAAATTLILALVPAALTGRQPAPAPAQQRPVFGTGVDLVLVHATVTDQQGHFVHGLRASDFELKEDGTPQPITAFSSERVPVSIGIALDVSNSMKGEKLRAAKGALFRLLDELLDPEDEVFLYGFSDEPVLLQSWTTRRDVLRRALERVSTGGLTALYDTTAQAVSLAATGKHRKKALVIVSDGTDTTSHTDVKALRRQIRESEVLVYAIGIDATAQNPPGSGSWAPWPPDRLAPPPDPPGRGGPQFPPRIPVPGQPRPPLGPGGTPPRGNPLPAGGEVDAYALRELTDDSGGRTEIIRSAADLSPATAGIADELSRQYFLGYHGAAPRDGQWHAIEVVVRRPGLHVRARSGYLAGR